MAAHHLKFPKPKKTQHNNGAHIKTKEIYKITTTTNNKHKRNINNSNENQNKNRNHIKTHEA